MASRAELKGRVSLNTTAYQNALRRMRRNLRKWGRTAARMARLAARGMAVVTGVAAGVAAAITRLTKATANAGDRFHKMALRTGQSVRALEEYDFIAQRTGTTAENIQKATRRMSRAIAGARDGLSTYTREFDRLGISMDDLEGIGTEAAFDRISKAIGEMNDEVQQASTAARLFSSTAGQQLLPMLKSGGEGIREMRDRLREIGFTFEREGADKAARFNDKLTDLKYAIAGVRNKMVLSFIDAFSDGIETLIQKIVEFRREGKFVEWAATGAGAVNNFVETSRKLFSLLVYSAVESWKVIETSGEVTWNALRVAGSGAVRGMAGLINRFVLYSKAIWYGLRTVGLVTWNLLKEAASVAFNSIQVAAIRAFSAIMKTAEGSINKIIGGLNKIPRVDIDPVNFDSIEKSEKKIDELEGKIRDSVDAMKITGDAWDPAGDAGKDLEKAKEEAGAIIKELDRQFFEENAKRLADITKKTGDMKLNMEKAVLAELQKQLKITDEHEKVREAISKWQNAAYEAERKRAEAARDGEDALAGQGDELGRQVRMSKRTMMGQALRRMAGRGEPQSQLVRQREGRSERERVKLAQDQLKVQRQIASNTERRQPAMAW